MPISVPISVTAQSTDLKAWPISLHNTEHETATAESTTLKTRPKPAAITLDAQDPLIYVAEGVIYAGASAALTSFADLPHAPVISTLTPTGALPETHPLFD